METEQRLEILEKLRSMILSGEIKAGTRLVQREIAKRFGTTTTPLREILGRLEAEGLVERGEDFQGLRVKCLNSDDIYGMGVVRRAIECEAVRLCAQSATSVELDLIFDIAEKCDNAIAEGTMSLKEREKLDYQFHYLIVKGAHCPALEKEFQRVQITKTYTHVVQNKAPDKMRENHLEIAGHLKKRDAEKAVKEMRKHLDRIIKINTNYMKAKELKNIKAEFIYVK